MKRTKRNTRVRRSGFVTKHAIWLAMLVLEIFSAVMIYWRFDSQANELIQVNGRNEAESRKLDMELKREMTKWDEMKTPDNLAKQLKLHALDMNVAEQVQIIHMNGGKVAPGQISVARLNAIRSRPVAINQQRSKTTSAKKVYRR